MTVAISSPRIYRAVITVAAEPAGALAVSAGGNALMPGHRSVTRVPCPGRLVTSAAPPTDSIRPMMDSRIPRLDKGTETASKPCP